MIGVADGVGGHAKREVCSGKCSKFLCRSFAESNKTDPSKPLREILTAGQKALIDAKIDGSTTVVLARLDPETRFHSVNMRTLNLGDSAYMIVRPEKDGGLDKVFRSEEQSHYFNCPF